MTLSPWVHVNVHWKNTYIHWVLAWTLWTCCPQTRALMLLNSWRHWSIPYSQSTITLTHGNWTKQTAHWHESTNDREGQSLCQIGQAALLEWTDSRTGTRITTMDFGGGRVETVTEYFGQSKWKNEGTLERKDCFSTQDFSSAAEKYNQRKSKETRHWRACRWWNRHCNARCLDKGHWRV